MYWNSCLDIKCEYWDGEEYCYVHEDLCPFHIANKGRNE